MINVSLNCRECRSHNDDVHVSFASKFEPNPGTEIEDTQAYMDINYLATCGGCSRRDWEVTKVEPVSFKRSM